MKKLIAVILVVASLACTAVFTSCKSDAEKAADAAKEAAEAYMDMLS